MCPLQAHIIAKVFSCRCRPINRKVPYVATKTLTHLYQALKTFSKRKDQQVKYLLKSLTCQFSENISDICLNYPIVKDTS